MIPFLRIPPRASRPRPVLTTRVIDAILWWSCEILFWTASAIMMVWLWKTL